MNVGRWVTGPIIPHTSLNNDMVPESLDLLPRASDGAVMHEPPASVPPAQQLISQKPWVTPSPPEADAMFPLPILFHMPQPTGAEPAP